MGDSTLFSGWLEDLYFTVILLPWKNRKMVKKWGSLYEPHVRKSVLCHVVSKHSDQPRQMATALSQQGTYQNLQFYHLASWVLLVINKLHLGKEILLQLFNSM